MYINVIRNNEIISSLPLLSATYTKRLMAEHQLVFKLVTVSPIEIQVGDTVTYKNEIMTINQVPEVKRSHKLEYTFIFEGVRHGLVRFLLKDEGALTFDYLDDLGGIMNMFLESINNVDGGWSLGELEIVEPFAVSFDKVDHLTALNMICEACQCEWQLKGKKISIKKTVGTFRNYPLSYGKDKGLYSITRKKIENGKIVTRAYAVGGAKNLPASYPYKEFTMDGYLEDVAAIEKYGIREGVYSNEDIYPKRASTVTQVAKINDNQFTIVDSTIDFNLNGQKIDGQDLFIVFLSGMLNSQQFKILSYDHATKTIRYQVNTDSNGGKVPSGVTLAEVGDKYTLIGLRMPQSYIDAQNLELKNKCLEFLNSNKVPRVVYEAPLDPLDLKRNNVEIEEGDILPFLDTKLGLDDNLRVTSVSYPATFPDFLPTGMIFTAEIGQEVTYTRYQKVENDIKENKEVITQTTKRTYENDRISAMRMRELQDLVFDPSGYFDGTKIKPNSIETLMLSVGAKSQNFMINGVRINVNHGDDANAILITAGQLVHLEVKIEGLGYIWNMTQLSKNDLDPVKPYYLSARCSRTELTGTWVISDVPNGTESETGFYHFNVGVIYNVFENKRDYSFTNGMTYINGANIKTGKISADRLDVNEIVISGGGATVNQMNEAKQQAIQAANAYSEANDDLLQLLAESYADGLVTAEEQARITDATQKLLEAKQHADAAAAAAKQEANNYTNSKFNELGALAFDDLVELAKLGDTIIQGGFLKTDLIDVINLFAQQIEATNIKITGQSKLGDWTIGDDGLGFSQLNATSLYTSGNNVHNREMSQSVEAITFARETFQLGGGSTPKRSVQVGFEKTSPLWVDAAGDVGLHIFSGTIQMGDKIGYTGKFTTGTSPLYSHYNYRGGVLVEFIQNSSSTNPF